MPKFRKRPVEVEVVQWFPPGDERHDAESTVVGGRLVGDITCDPGGEGIGPPIYSLKTLVGPMRLSPGDWIFTEADGSRRACWPDRFDATYEAVSE